MPRPGPIVLGGDCAAQRGILSDCSGKHHPGKGLREREREKGGGDHILAGLVSDVKYSSLRGLCPTVMPVDHNIAPSLIALTGALGPRELPHGRERQKERDSERDSKRVSVPTSQASQANLAGVTLARQPN